MSLGWGIKLRVLAERFSGSSKRRVILYRERLFDFIADHFDRSFHVFREHRVGHPHTLAGVLPIQAFLQAKEEILTRNQDYVSLF